MIARGSSGRCDLTENVALLVSWALRICLEELAADGDDAFARHMVSSGGEYDLLRAEARALPLPQTGGLRVGLIVQPYFWALALAMLDICYLRRESIDRPCADRGLITSLETNRATKAIETEASALVELAAERLDATPGLSPAGLHGPCEMCEAGALKCHRFSPTPHRPELCACIHGAPYHACVDPREARSKPGAPRSGLPGAPQPAGPSTPEPTSSSRRDFVLAELLRRCATFLSSAGSEGIRDLLGLRRTAGSLESSLPPPRRTLLEALNRPHATPAVGPVAAAAHPAPSSPAREGAVAAAEEGASSAHKRRARGKRATIVCNLTVGGRALCKHAVRGEEGWWGGSGGTEADKNGRAERAALRVLAGATWVNLHVFGGGGGDGVFEVREASGYGARWSTDGAVFRGFLEPHMEDGHEKGWRH